MGSVCFRIVKGLVYKIFVEASGETSLLLAPSSLRESVLVTVHNSVMSGHAGVAPTTRIV